MADPVFLTGTLSASALILLMAATVFSRNFKFWPPTERNWKWLTYWILAGLNTLAILVLVLNAVEPELTLRFLAGGLLAFTGTVVTAASILQLGFERTSGIQKDLIRKGFYRYSRNPQVLGNLLTLTGITVAVPQLEITVLSSLTGLWLLIMIPAEEKWLEKEVGEEYREYMEEVPRFI